MAVGHYKPINSERFVNDCHEFVFHFTRDGRTPLDRTAIGVPYQDASNVARWRSGGENRRCRGNTWFIPYETIQSRDKDRPHPATFPPRLPEYCFKLHGLPRLKLAMDPFLGLGSSAVAAAELDVDFVGIEMDAHYLKEAIARVRMPPFEPRRGEHLLRIQIGWITSPSWPPNTLASLDVLDRPVRLVAAAWLAPHVLIDNIPVEPPRFRRTHSPAPGGVKSVATSFQRTTPRCKILAHFRFDVISSEESDV